MSHLDSFEHKNFDSIIPAQLKNERLIRYLMNLISYDTTKSEVECMKYIENILFEQLWEKITIEKQDIWDNGRYNLIIKNTDDPKLLLAWHIDVVPVQSETQFDPYIEWDKLYGRWSTDMKWWVSILMDILPDLASSDTKFRTLFYCDEEYYFKWMKAFTEKHKRKIQPELVIIPEPTDNKLLLSFRWCVECDITLQGKASHAARKHEWVSAIDEMTLFYQQLQKFLTSKDTQDFWFTSAVNLAHIQWGYQNDTGELIKRANIVPNHATATFDIRLWNDISQDEFDAFCDEYFKHRETEIKTASWIKEWLTLLKKDIKFWLSPLLQKHLESTYSKHGEINPWTEFGYSDIQMIKEHIWGDCIQVWAWPNEKSHQGDEYVSIPMLLKAREQIRKLLSLS